MIKKLIILFCLSGLFSCQTADNSKQIFYEKNGFLGTFKEFNISNDNVDAIVSNSFPGDVLKITNLLNNKSIILNNIKKQNFESSRLLYTSDSVREKLQINKDIPYVKIEISKLNPTFVASKAEIFKEERKVPNTSKVSNVEVISIHKNDDVIKSVLKKKSIYLQFGSFYEVAYAKELEKNLNNIVKLSKIYIDGSKKRGYYVIIGPISKVNNYDKIYTNLKNKNYDGYEIIIK
jgi:hypothetical protein